MYHTAKPAGLDASEFKKLRLHVFDSRQVIQAAFVSGVASNRKIKELLIADHAKTLKQTYITPTCTTFMLFDSLL